MFNFLTGTISWYSIILVLLGLAGNNLSYHSFFYETSKLSCVPLQHFAEQHLMLTAVVSFIYSFIGMFMLGFGSLELD